MNVTDFNKLTIEILDKVKNTLIKKQDEYNLDPDRLAFFKKASVLKDEYPHQTLLGYTNKQIVSEFDMGMSGKDFCEELWNEKIIDIICYQILLYAVLKDTDMFTKKVTIKK